MLKRGVFTINSLKKKTKKLEIKKVKYIGIFK
jgi:hypothetical protein